VSAAAVWKVVSSSVVPCWLSFDAWEVNGSLDCVSFLGEAGRDVGFLVGMIGAVWRGGSDSWVQASSVVKKGIEFLGVFVLSASCRLMYSGQFLSELA